MKVTPYGRREIVAAGLLAGLAAALVAVLAWAFSPLFLIALALPLGGWILVLTFFRDPPREAPSAEGLFVSPADGRVADITPIGPDSPLGADGVQVGIFMSVFDVHVNRCPETGRVDRIERRRGAFLDARDPQAAGRNEATTIRITCARGETSFPIVVRQVAGLIARRIVTDLAEGQNVRRGQRIGMIKFGSRVELMVPRGQAGRVLVEVGRRVRAGQTVLIAAGDNSNDPPR